MKILEIPLSDILPDFNQPRKTFEKSKLEELANSIKQNGVLFPIIVRRAKDKYVIIAGERRYRAAIMAGLTSIKASVYDGEDFAEIALIENLQREDLNPVEEAEAINSLIKSKGLTQEKAAIILGKSRPYVANILRFLKLDEYTKQALISGKISETHARALASVLDIEKRHELLSQITDKNLSVRVVEEQARKLKKKDVYKTDILSKLEEKYHTEVRISGSKGGKIMLSYFSEDDLNRLLELLL